MNNYQYKSIYHLLYAILCVLTAILAYLGKQISIQEWIDASREHARIANNFNKNT